MNRAIRPLADDKHYGRLEFWTIPADGYGDCEDYALAKRARLIETGFPAGLLRLALVITPRGARHVVLTVSTSQGDYLLDSLFDQILPWDQAGYRWLMRQKTEDARGWAALDLGRNS
jgi:predicted transglutaminase-like cysteine proteinase